MMPPSLAKKMRRQPEARSAIIHAPADYEKLAFPGMAAAAPALSGTFDGIQIFVRNEAELKKLAPAAEKALKPAGLLWISFPKGSSKIQTDLTRDQGWESLKKLDLKWVNLISVDETWSAFALRPYRPGEARTRAWS